LLSVIKILNNCACLFTTTNCQRALSYHVPAQPAWSLKIGQWYLFKAYTVLRAIPYLYLFFP